jgi:hypothetical protein
MYAIITTTALILLAVISGLVVMFIVGTFIWALVAIMQPEPPQIDEDN